MAPRVSRPAQMPSASPVPLSPITPIPVRPVAPLSNISKPVAPAAIPAAAPEVRTILASLTALSENWPATLRLEITQLNLSGAQVALPVNLVEPALRRGRVVFPWHSLRSWIRPAPPGISIHDGMELELPLKVLAPLFLPPQKTNVKPSAQVTLPPSNVPNLFFGFPQPQPEEMAAPLNAPEAVPMVKSVDAKLAETDYYVWGDSAEAPRVDEADYKRPLTPATDFSSRRAMPKEIIERAIKLPGVVGTVIALPDGLKVAHHLPPDLNPDTVAAFLPQLFSRVSQCSKELRMGELNNLNFTTGNVPWKIFRVNSVYFAAFGRAGAPLPTAQLAALAAELDRKK
jgi:predicted regulator of Ras-like GTPase activity (Roadblock/LC7/MglB family)